MLAGPLPKRRLAEPAAAASRHAPPAAPARALDRSVPSTRRRGRRQGVGAAAIADERLQEQEVPILPQASSSDGWTDRYGGDARKGSDILVQALEREGVDTVFAYPGGASMEIHQALTRSDAIRNILCRHEQGEVFAAEGWGKCTGTVGVCIATSGPGATNLVTGLADALLDSVPMVAITGQVPRPMIGTDAFQETPIVEITRQITKHNYLVLDIADLPRIVKEAFYLARTGRPGPVLIDVPKDIQQQLHVPVWDPPMSLTGYMNRLPSPPVRQTLQPVLDALHACERPVAYIGGGCLDAGAAVTAFLDATGIPTAQTLMGLGAYPMSRTDAHGMLGMHGTSAANCAVDEADLLLAIGVRFDDRVTGKLETFAARARIVHIDIDPAEIHKNKEAHVPVCADAREALPVLNAMLEDAPIDAARFAPWREYLQSHKAQFPMRFPKRDDVIIPQWAIQVLHEETKGEAIITTGVGQHQMWAAQWYPFDAPRRWVSSGGLGSMGFGLPSALGAAAAFDGKNGREKRTVIDIDGDGSFLMNCQEMATAHVEGLDTKMVILNNQHLGMVVQWEDRFYKANRAHTYLGRREAEYHLTGEATDIYPDFVKMAESFGVPSERVFRPEELRPAVQRMLSTEGPYLLDVMVPHVEHVLPMIPGGGGYKDIILEGDGTWKY